MDNPVSLDTKSATFFPPLIDTLTLNVVSISGFCDEISLVSFLASLAGPKNYSSRPTEILWYGLTRLFIDGCLRSSEIVFAGLFSVFSLRCGVPLERRSLQTRRSFTLVQGEQTSKVRAHRIGPLSRSASTIICRFFFSFAPTERELAQCFA